MSVLAVAVSVLVALVLGYSAGRLYRRWRGDREPVAEHLRGMLDDYELSKKIEEKRERF